MHVLFTIFIGFLLAISVYLVCSLVGYLIQRLCGDEPSIEAAFSIGFFAILFSAVVLAVLYILGGLALQIL